MGYRTVLDQEEDERRYEPPTKDELAFYAEMGMGRKDYEPPVVEEWEEAA